MSQGEPSLLFTLADGHLFTKLPSICLPHWFSHSKAERKASSYLTAEKRNLKRGSLLFLCPLDVHSKSWTDSALLPSLLVPWHSWNPPAGWSKWQSRETHFRCSPGPPCLVLSLQDMTWFSALQVSLLLEGHRCSWDPWSLKKPPWPLHQPVPLHTRSHLVL